jgi:uncharacterized protein (TIGR04255 family)
MSGNLPDFDKPPVIEVILSLQFEPLESLRTPHMGLFWTRIKEDYPLSEEHASIDPIIEEFGVDSASDLGRNYTSAPVRHWYINRNGTSLIQIQKDRFIHNWRRREESDEYPRFENVLTSFIGNLQKFTAFLKDEKLGTIVPNQ